MIPFLEISEAIRKEIFRASQLHKPIHNFHEAHSIILEEFEEFWEEVKKKSEVRRNSLVCKELIETAAMCIRAIQDVMREHDVLSEVLK